MQSQSDEIPESNVINTNYKYKIQENFCWYC